MNRFAPYAAEQRRSRGPPSPPEPLQPLKAGIVSSQEIVAAINLYLRDPAAGHYRFASGHTIDVAALVNATPAFGAVDRLGPQEKAFPTVLAAAVMSAYPTTASSD